MVGYGYEECDYGDIVDEYDQNYDDPNYPPEVSAGRGQAQSKQTPNGDGTSNQASAALFFANKGCENP